MKKFVSSILVMAFALAAVSAQAADLPSRKEGSLPPAYAPPPVSLPLWTGFHAGLNIGAHFQNSAMSTSAGVAQFNDSFGLYGNPGFALASAGLASVQSPTSGVASFIGGGQVGYDYQFGGFVVGVETDIQGLAGASSSVSSFSAAPVSSPLLSTVNVTKNVDYIGTLRARAGYLVTPTLLVYGTAGLAYGGVSSNASVFQSLSNPFFYSSPAWGGAGHYSDTRVGWTAGAGAEWMFLPKWSLKGEYLYYDLGSVTYNAGALANAPVFGGPNIFTNVVQASTRFDGHLARVGVNYHF